MARTPQRDVNLAQKLIAMSTACLDEAQIILLPNVQVAPDPGAELRLTVIENKCLDLIAFMRDYRRKVNPVEVKGQRG